MTITIRSTREGFWRCGVKHSLEAKEYPDDRFNAEEIERLMADPTLVVIVTQGEGGAEIFGPDDTVDPFKMTLAELKKLAKDMGLTYAKNVKQAELAQMVNDEMASSHLAEIAAHDKAAATANQPQGEPEPPAADGVGNEDNGALDLADTDGEPTTE